jgi:hypothetical protein
MLRMQWVVCPACGRGHTFSVAAAGPVARAYGYTCPATGHPAAIGLRGQWTPSADPRPGGGGLVAARGRGGGPRSPDASAERAPRRGFRDGTDGIGAAPTVNGSW